MSLVQPRELAQAQDVATPACEAITQQSIPFETIARQMAHIESSPASRDLLGEDKKLLVLHGLKTIGIISKGATGSDPMYAAASAVIDGLIWAAKHKKEISAFMKKQCCCCG